jgi:hypothetical protein
MSSADVLAYLIDKQRKEGIPALRMAERLGISETNWCHARKGRRGLTVKQIERAIELYPEIADVLGHREPEAMAV